MVTAKLADYLQDRAAGAGSGWRTLGRICAPTGARSRGSRRCRGPPASPRPCAGSVRWIQAYAPELEKRIRPHLRTCNGSWRVDETYVKVKGRWTYLYRAVDSRGQTIDFLLSANRDAAAAKRFFRKALGQPHTVNP